MGTITCFRETLETLRRVAVYEEIRLKGKGISPPRRIVVVPTTYDGGLYYYPDETVVVYLSDAPHKLNPIRTLLHEIAHHVQYYEAGKDARKAFDEEERRKPWGKRRHEREAEEYAWRHSIRYRAIYESLINKLKEMGCI